MLQPIVIYFIQHVTTDGTGKQPNRSNDLPHTAWVLIDFSLEGELGHILSQFICETRPV